MNNINKNEKIPEEANLISRMRISALWAVLFFGYIYEDFVSLFKVNYKKIKK